VCRGAAVKDAVPTARSRSELLFIARARSIPGIGQRGATRAHNANPRRLTQGRDRRHSRSPKPSAGKMYRSSDGPQNAS
jgi:hypothetical protein